MITTTEIEIFNPYGHVNSEFLNGLDALTADPMAVPVIALLSQRPEGLTLNQTRDWLNYACDPDLGEAYSAEKVRTLGMHLGASGVTEMVYPEWGDLSATLMLRPETAGLYTSLVGAIGSWQVDNWEASWKDMLAKTTIFKYAAVDASYAFGLLHTMSANGECTGGTKVPDWDAYDLAMSRLIKLGIAECIKIDEGLNSYRLAEPHQKPAAELIDLLHSAAANGMNEPRFEEFIGYELSADSPTHGMIRVIQKSMPERKKAR